MNAQTTNPLTNSAIENPDVLRAIAAAQLASPAAVAKAANVPPKNIARTLSRLQADGLVRIAGGVFGLTAAGALALQAIDLADGRAEAGGAGAPGNDVLLLKHHEIRPNPLNPRKLDLTDPAQREKLDGLKSQIIAAGDVLQNLVVFPADAEGVHTLFVGERRWTAVGELIAEGLWDAGRTLRAIQRENTPGQSAFIALVENSQEALTVLERARGYQALVAETGWSGREAALRTGWDVKSVQQYLQVLREADPAHIAAHEAGDPDWTWEALRKSVQEPKAATEAEPALADLEDAADPLVVDGVRYPNATRANEARRIAEGGGPVNSGGKMAGKTPQEPPLSPIAKLALIELAYKLNHESVEPNAQSARLVKVWKYWLDQTTSELSGAGLINITHGWSGGPHAGLSIAGRQMLKAFGVDAGVVLFNEVYNARLRAGVEAERARQDEFVTPWLNEPAPGIGAHVPSAAAVQPPASHRSEDDETDEAETEAAEVLTKVRAGIASGLFGSQGSIEFRDLLETAGLLGPFATAPAHPGQVAARNDLVAVCDVDGEIADDLARARAELIAFCLNAFAGFSTNVLKG